MNRQKSLTHIAELLSRFTNEVTILNEAGLYDINIHSENILIPLINIAYNLEVVNANFSEEKNFSAVDLIDNKNRVAFQVTSTADNEKIKHTLSQFIRYNRYLNYDLLFIYVISNKQQSYTGKGHEEILQGKLVFDKDNHIIDNKDLFKKISSIVALEQILAIETILEQEFTDQKIELRKKSLEDPESVQHIERIYFNLLEAVLPDHLYVADIDLDREAIIKESWTTKYKLRMDASPRKVIRRAIDMAGFTYILDWHALGNQIITFRNISDPADDLRNFVDKGTITIIKPQEYWSSGDDHKRNFTALLNFTLQEKLRHKAIQWVKEDQIYRYKQNGGIIKQRTVSWKKTNKATRTVIFEMFDKDKKQIVCFRHFSFACQFNLFNDKWFLSVNPTWSFTSDGYSKSGLSKFYAAGLKRLENNKTLYYAFRFIAFCLRNTINNENAYPYLSFNEAIYDEVTSDFEAIAEDESVEDEYNEIKNNEY